MIRYKIGNIVEVLDENELPSGSWRCAEVVSGNGDDFLVITYCDESDESGEVLETVSRRLIRPCPPLVEPSEEWYPGDVVEVFQNYTWKMATVSKVVGKDRVLVRLVGFLDEFEVMKCYVRVRQSWKNGQWSLVGKGRVRKYNRISGFQSEGTKPRNVEHRGSSIGSSRNLRRRHPYRLSQTEANIGTAQNYRVNRGRFIENHIEMRIESDDVGSTTSSVGSCSIDINDIPALRPTLSVGFVGDTQGCSSDAESVHDSCNCSAVPSKFPLEVRRLELYAYRATLEAFYASGPLSWEQETLITNLRISLNISNDEHLSELRNLKSVPSSCSVS